MRSALWGALAHVGRHAIFAIIAIASIVAFVAIAGGSDAQTGQQIAVVPIHDDPSPSSAVVDSPTETVIESSAPARPPAVAQSTATRKNTPAAVPTSSSPSATVTTGQAATTTRHFGHSSTSSSSPGPSIFRYARSRDIAALINPARENHGWTDVTTVAVRNDASCIANQTCTGQLGSCGEQPLTIGTSQTSQVYDGQYEDQYGNCREVIVI